MLRCLSLFQSSRLKQCGAGRQTFSARNPLVCQKEDMEDDPMMGTIYGVGENAYIGSIRNVAGIKKRAAEGYINHRAYMTFRDGRGLSWQRDTHGRLRPVRRPIDWAPRAGRMTGRISWWRRGGP
jgi:hypothetical protein